MTGPGRHGDRTRPHLTLLDLGNATPVTDIDGDRMQSSSKRTETMEAKNPDIQESVTTQAYRRLRQDILFNVLKPSEKLRIEALRDSYGLGATPIREALSLLTADGLVERLDQRGFRVAAASLDDFKDIHATRCWLEERALRASIAASTIDWEETIVLNHHRLARAQRERADADFHPSANWEQHHRAFHISLIANCGSPTLLRFCEQLYDLNIRYRYIAADSAYPTRNVEDEHRSIADCVVRRDADTSVDLLIQHYRRTGAFLDERLSCGLPFAPG